MNIDSWVGTAITDNIRYSSSLLEFDSRILAGLCSHLEVVDSPSPSKDGAIEGQNPCSL